MRNNSTSGLSRKHQDSSVYRTKSHLISSSQSKIEEPFERDIYFPLC